IGAQRAPEEVLHGGSPALEPGRLSLGPAIAELGLEEDQRVVVQLPGPVRPGPGRRATSAAGTGARGARLFRILWTLAALVYRVLRASGPEAARFGGDLREDLARQLFSLESHLSPPGKKIDFLGFRMAAL